MARRETITADEVNQLLAYNPDTGALTWKARTPDMFEDGAHSAEHTCAKWNGRYSGKEAGNVKSSGYRKLSIFNRSFRAPRIIWLLMTGAWPKGEVDHVNLNKDDNSWSNLRQASRAQNNSNKSARPSESGIKCVRFQKSSGNWLARISVRGQEIHLGSFDSSEAASRAYAEAAMRFHGEFARVG